MEQFDEVVVNGMDIEAVEAVEFELLGEITGELQWASVYDKWMLLDDSGYAWTRVEGQWGLLEEHQFWAGHSAY